MYIDNILFFGLICFSLLLWIRWRRKKLSLFKRFGIPGPQPSILFGNIRELNKKGPFECHKQWIKEYGKIIGYYHGMKPVLLVADPDLLKKVFIKDFHMFSDRPESVPLRIHTFPILDDIIPASKLMDSLLTNLKEERWKSVRSILSHTFTANKLKTMIPAVNELVDISVSILEEKCTKQEVIDIHKHLQRLTLDIICAQAFAMDVNSQKNPNHPFLESAKVMFDLPYNSSIMFLGKCFPELGFIAMALNFSKMVLLNKGRIPPLEITNVLEKIIKIRRKNFEMRKPDLLQLLIDASCTKEERDSCSGNEIKGKESSKLTKRLTLNDLEIKANALIVFLGGFETTSTALGFAFHFLALYPDIQKKIQNEIDQVIEKQGELNYYNVNNFQYMERFILETMRFYSPASFFVTRIAKEEIDYGYIRIPKGVQVEVPTQYIHQSDEFWHEPEKFDPDR